MEARDRQTLDQATALITATRSRDSALVTRLVNELTAGELRYVAIALTTYARDLFDEMCELSDTPDPDVAWAHFTARCAAAWDSEP